MNQPTDDNKNEPSSQDQGYVLPRKDYKVAPLASRANPAADVIRDKLAKIYATEPDPFQEEQQAEAAKTRSKHQQYMIDLHNSGKDLAQVQTEWHNYYVNLPDDEKHAVWKEFYASNDAAKPAQQPVASNPLLVTEAMTTNRVQIAAQSPVAKRARHTKRPTREIQDDIRQKVKKPVSARRRHLHSIVFGVSVGLIVVVINLFTFFNQILIAPLIQPSRTATATPLIVGGETAAPSAESEVIIPKINVEIPIRFNVASNDEETMQKELDLGVAHYPTTSNPGEQGNAAIFGHSSNNIFNKGKYKFAFVLLHKLEIDDTFYITKDGKIYAYKVFDKKVVEPSQIDVLNPVEGHTATATLITCDPPGTTKHRLVITGDQISPDPLTNVASTAASDTTTVATTDQLAGNGQSLWARLIGSVGGKIFFAIIVIAAIVFLVRRITKIR